MDWRHQAACRDEDPELFFPVGNTGPAITQIEEAKKVCMRCTVREQCLAWALESGQDSGHESGYDDGYNQGFKEAERSSDESYEQGYRQGLEDGKQQSDTE